MVCVNSNVLFDEFIIPGETGKVNRFGRTFTICLQNPGLPSFPLTKSSKNTAILHIDAQVTMCYYLAR